MSDSVKNEVEKQELEQELDQSLVKARDEYKNDMFKFKERAKQAEAELERLRKEAAIKEKQQLEKNQEWKLLYEKEKTEREALSNDLNGTKKKFVDSSKINAVVQHIGGFKKSDYNKFINPEAIELGEDGHIDEASLKAEADRIKQNYPELLKASSTQKLPDDAAHNVETVNKSLKEMSVAELKAHYAKLNK